MTDWVDIETNEEEGRQCIECESWFDENYIKLCIECEADVCPECLDRHVCVEDES